jgi:molybdopterin-guanine dinucleotide biosynthesis protein A
MGRDKATMPHPSGSTTMVRHLVDVLSTRCAPVLVIAAQGQALPDLGDAGVLRDEVRGVGPLLATARGLRAAAEAGCERAFVCAVDMPYLTAALVDELSGHLGADVVLPWDGRDHYLAGVYRTDLAGRIDALIAAGRRSMRALTDTVLTQRVVLEPAAALVNLNTVADLPAPD